MTTAVVPTQSDVASSQHVINTCPQILTVNWSAGTEWSAGIGPRIAAIPGGAEELTETILRYFRVYLGGVGTENRDQWRELFGSVHHFLAVARVTIGFTTMAGKPHLLRFWENEHAPAPIATVASFDFNALLQLQKKLLEEVQAKGLFVCPIGAGPRGVTHVLER